MDVNDLREGAEITTTKDLLIRVPECEAREKIKIGSTLVCGKNGIINPNEIEIWPGGKQPMRFIDKAELANSAEPV